MRFPTNRLLACILTSLALVVAGCGERVQPPVEAERLSIGLMSSLPIYWSGGDAFAELSQDSTGPHWARAALEKAHDLEPLDSLAPEQLKELDLLILAQPRVLSPLENVALDDFVRAGGSAIVFADPALVLKSEFPLGDPRRPMDTVLLSPILTRWGLELTFDPAEAGELRRVNYSGIPLDVVAAGRFQVTGADGALCATAAEGVVASCAIGAGRAILIADATILEDSAGTDASVEVLTSLIARASEPVRENAGPGGE